MHAKNLPRWQHSHSFGQDRRRPGEVRTLIVVILTSVTMVVELIGGSVLGSMALLADGLHMGSHSVALAISLFAYVYARRHAHSDEFSFGTGKVNALGGFSGAILLAMFSAFMAWESVHRLFAPTAILFDQALIVALLGLLVNAISVVILGVQHDHGEHEHAHHHDHNLKSAYLHVLADALTSVLAIVALLIGKFCGVVWVDPLIGILGALLVGRWSIGLLAETSAVLLDRQASGAVCEKVVAALEADGDSRVVDLHVWAIGPGLRAAIISLVAHQPDTPQNYKSRLPHELGLAHVSVEVQTCCGQSATG